LLKHTLSSLHGSEILKFTINITGFWRILDIFALAVRDNPDFTKIIHL